MKRAYYSNSIADFVDESCEAILGKIVSKSDFPVEQTQRDSWIHQIQQLKLLLAALNGSIYFEYSIPRMGKRVDVVLVIGAAIFVIEYKVGEQLYSGHAIDQVDIDVAGAEASLRKIGNQYPIVLTRDLAKAK